MILFPFGVRNDPNNRYPGIRAARPNFFSTNTPGGGEAPEAPGGGDGGSGPIFVDTFSVDGIATASAADTGETRSLNTDGNVILSGGFAYLDENSNDYVLLSYVGAPPVSHSNTIEVTLCAFEGDSEYFIFNADLDANAGAGIGWVMYINDDNDAVTVTRFDSLHYPNATADSYSMSVPAGIAPNEQVKVTITFSTNGNAINLSAKGASDSYEIPDRPYKAYTDFGWYFQAYNTNRKVSEVTILPAAGNAPTLTGEFVGYSWTNATNTNGGANGLNTSTAPGDPLPNTEAGAYSSDLVSTDSPFEVEVRIDTDTSPNYTNVVMAFVPEQSGTFEWLTGNGFVLGFWIDDTDNIHIHLVNKDGSNQVAQAVLTGNNVRIRFHSDGTAYSNDLVVTMSNDDFATSTPIGTFSVVAGFGDNVILKLMYIEPDTAGKQIQVLYRSS